MGNARAGVSVAWAVHTPKMTVYMLNMVLMTDAIAMSHVCDNRKRKFTATVCIKNLILAFLPCVVLTDLKDSE